jgi:regulator of protease activity HflC (stomatin/prohibitin superfamily)
LPSPHSAYRVSASSTNINARSSSGSGGTRTRAPGIFWLIPLIEWQQLVDLRTVTAAVEEQETITKDNVPVKINAVVWYRIVDPRQAMLEVRSVDNAVIQVALTTLRTGIGQYSLDDVLKAQDTVSKTIEAKIDAVTEPWGVKVERVERRFRPLPGELRPQRRGQFQHQPRRDDRLHRAREADRAEPQGDGDRPARPPRRGQAAVFPAAAK